MHRSAPLRTLYAFLPIPLSDWFAHLRAMGIETVMITGDNPLTATAIAAEAGVDDSVTAVGLA